jgi:hypothetical protein
MNNLNYDPKSFMALGPGEAIQNTKVRYFQILEILVQAMWCQNAILVPMELATLDTYPRRWTYRVATDV